MPTHRLLVRDPDKAYVSDTLWLPRALIPENAFKEALQYYDVENGQAVTRKLWSETKHHLICPREFLKPEQYPQFSFPFVDIAPKRFPKANIWVKYEPRNEEQQRAWEALKVADGGILNLACGKGKTFLALKKIEQLGCPALIVVHNGFLLNQWLSEALPKFAELPLQEKVGIIQGPDFDWQRPIVIAMIHTLAARVEEGKIPPGFREHFGVVVYDEVHHLSAPLFVQTATAITGLRFGLTATDKRLDGMDFIYKAHLGPVFYSDLVQTLIPRIYFQQTPIWTDLDTNEEVKDKRGEMHLGKLRSFVGADDVSNDFRAYCIKEALDQGRKILCVSQSKIQLRKLHERFPGSSLIISETPMEERARLVKKSRVCFAIDELGTEGLDDDDLDTIFVLFPMGSKNAPPNDLQQLMGRGQREKDGRNAPVLIIFDDVAIGPFHGQCHLMRKQLKEWNKHVPGMPALAYQTLAVPDGAPRPDKPPPTRHLSPNEVARLAHRFSPPSRTGR